MISLYSSPGRSMGCVFSSEHFLLLLKSKLNSCVHIRRSSCELAPCFLCALFTFLCRFFSGKRIFYSNMKRKTSTVLFVQPGAFRSIGVDVFFCCCILQSERVPCMCQFVKARPLGMRDFRSTLARARKKSENFSFCKT